MRGDRDVAVPLWSEGYARFDLNPMIEALGAGDDLEKLKACFRDLPIDPYNVDAGRYRRLARGLYFPWKAAFEWLPDEISASGQAVTVFFQGDHNREHQGKTRYFASIPQEIKSNAALQAIVMNATSRVDWESAEYCRPVAVGVHFVSQRVTVDQPVSVVTPTSMHQDGETYGYVHLLERSNVENGWNVVAQNEAIGLNPAEVPIHLVLQRFRLEQPLQGFGLRDAEVCHGVEPITLTPGSDSGFRNTILIDLTPMREIPR